MEYQNSSVKTLTNIGLFCREIDRQIYGDTRYLQLMEVVKEYPMTNYALYSDSILIKENLFMPIFHTMYLANGINAIILANTDDFWITEIFTNNIYYIIDQSNGGSRVENQKIKTIKHIREIL
jgi:hypothetical protein